ncbi:cytochrome P450 [Crepidotus variabilis]|uniref:Cytochrome P450 n=1 Tax=Crepidotus variabilis TaxID=179855 RepID=A0A9P6EIZ5_9AGAR|nr:cytochrome P450 [Crepidotus variabilis]
MPASETLCALVGATRLVLGYIFFLFLLWLFLQTLRPTRHLPPGPYGSLISGVIKALPRKEPWKVYAEWSKQFESPVISFRIFNRVTVVLNTLEAATTLLSHRSEWYSDRPRSVMYNEICGRGQAVFNIPASHPRHKIYRKILQTGLGKKATENAKDIIQTEAFIFADGLRTNPDQWQTYIRRNAVGVIVKVAFGYRIESLSDSFVRIAEESSNITAQALAPGRWLVDYFPFLQYLPSCLPGLGWKRQGLVWKERLNHLSGVPHSWVKEQMQSGYYEDSLTSNFLSEIQDNASGNVKEREDIVKWCAAALYAGAADTTVSALTSFVLLMALHPEEQKKAQLEVDQEFRSNFDFVDVTKVHKLSYLDAVLKEVLRFAPVGNMALPHSASQSDEYLGYEIPKGSTVVANVWAILHDESIYPEPFVFKPSRFGSNGKSGNSPDTQMDPTTVAFGFGRRTCPGSHFAMTTMLVGMACVLAEFNVECDDPHSKLQTIEFTTGITSHVKPFPIRITRRIGTK